MRWVLAFIALQLGMRTAHADPPKRAIARCTIGGRSIKLGEVLDAMVATPTGRLVILAGDGTLHAYRPHAGAACKLDVDRTFGSGGVLDTKIGSDFATARLQIDSRGVMYADRGSKQSRIEAARVSTMCGEGLVAASVKSTRVWRWSSISDATVGSGDCKDVKHVRLSSDFAMGHIWAIDDRVVTMDDRELRLYAADGSSHVKLENPYGPNLGPVRFQACGDAICALGYSGLVAWDSKGAQIETLDLDTMLHAGSATNWRGFAMLGATGYGLAIVDDKTEVVRLDGITTWGAAK